MKQIIYDDENAARFVENIKGWVDINNRFFGNHAESQHMARYSSCTHRKCACGELMTKGYTKCRNCIEKNDIEKYNALPFQEWNGSDPVYSRLASEYFFSEDEIEDYCDENDIYPSELRLVLCTENHFSIWLDDMPEDHMELPSELIKAINVFNDVIDKLPACSCSPGKIRTLCVLDNE
jgi:hypothetical protein